jgi:gliding motility-associated lipoprotein GldH
MKNYVHFPVLVMAVMISSCDPQMVYDHYEKVDGGNWDWDQKMVFPVDISDTTRLQNLYLQIRHTVEYPMSNLYVFIEVEGPDGQQLWDSVNMILAEPGGRWNGRGKGKLRELQLLYRKQTRFAKSGIYTFTLEQGMRRSRVPVTDVGIRIELANP